VKKKMYLVLITIVIIAGWLAIQKLFNDIPFSKEDLTISYYISKIVTESVYILSIILVIISQIISLFKTEKV
jgi:hypothetical protein